MNKKIRNAGMVLTVVLMTGLLSFAYAEVNSEKEINSYSLLEYQKVNEDCENSYQGSFEESKCGEGKCGEGKCGEGKSTKKESKKETKEVKKSAEKSKTSTTKETKAAKTTKTSKKTESKCGAGKCGGAK